MPIEITPEELFLILHHLPLQPLTDDQLLLAATSLRELTNRLILEIERRQPLDTATPVH